MRPASVVNADELHVRSAVSNALDHHRTLPVRRAGGGDDRGRGGDIGGHAEAAAPFPRLGDDFLEPVEGLAHQQAYAVDELVARYVGFEIGLAQALEISLDQRALPADDGPRRRAIAASTRCSVSRSPFTSCEVAA